MNKNTVFFKIVDSRILNVVCIFMNIFAIILVYSNLDHYGIGLFTSSDSLYLPSIWKDVMIDGTGFAGWHLNGAPNFFPDMFLYFMIRSVISNWLLAMVVFSILQCIIVIVLSYLIIRTFIEKITPIFLNVGILMMLLILYISLSYNFFYHTYLFLSMTYHMGSYVMFLLAFLLLGRYLKNEKFVTLVLLFLTMTIAIFNDRLFIFQFIIPVFVLLPLVFIKTIRKKLLMFYASEIIAVLLGITIFSLIDLSDVFDIFSVNEKFFQWINIRSSMLNLFRNYSNLFTGVLIYITVGGLVILSWAFMVVFSILGIRKLIKNKTIRQDFKLEIIYCLLVTSYSLIIFLAPALCGNYLGMGHDRYNLYFIFFNLFNISYLIFKAAVYIKNRNAITISILLFIVINMGILLDYSLKINITKGLSDFVHYYPDKVKKVDALARQYKLKYGLADYWLAKYITMFSREDLRVYHVLVDLKVWLHVTNEHWYYGGVKGKYSNPAFNFIILNNLDSSIVVEKMKSHITDIISDNQNTMHIVLTEPFKIKRPSEYVFVNEQVREQ